MSLFKGILFIIISVFFVNGVHAQQKTYCNPINIDYGYTPIPHFTTKGKHRTTADPVIINFKNTYFLFSTNQWGYWWSTDLLNWNFIYKKFLLPRHHTYDDLCAPAVFVMKDTVYVIGSRHDPDFPLWKSGNPLQNQWTIAIDSFKVGAWDPGFFYDQELNKLFLYWGSSNTSPILGTEINIHTLQSTGFTKPVAWLNPEIHGWEKFGEYNDNVFLQPFIEGAWMTKYKNKYYLQYGAPGTEFSGYGDGVWVSTNPLEKFEYQKHNPFSYKPGGFVRGAGHGSTFQDNYNNWWHISTIAIGVKNNFERRLGIWPAGFDNDDILFANTAYGDYPTLLPEYAKDKNFINNVFAGWMLLNYNKPVQVSSTLGGYQANYAVDEDIKTYWSAQTANAGEFIQSDMGEICNVYAIQINYADQDVEFLGKTLNQKHQYKMYYSLDAKNWKILVDKSSNQTDIPHDYIELKTPTQARFIKLENIKMPTGKFAISGLRIFGKGTGKAPNQVQNFIVLRGTKNTLANRMSSWLQWTQNQNADGYVIYFGTSPNKLYNHIMIYGKNEYYLTAMDKNEIYYFQIEAFNHNGISEKTEILKVE